MTAFKLLRATAEPLGSGLQAQPLVWLEDIEDLDFTPDKPGEIKFVTITRTR